jgi:hypothetical protein
VGTVLSASRAGGFEAKGDRKPGLAHVQLRHDGREDRRLFAVTSFQILRNFLRRLLVDADRVEQLGGGVNEAAE